MREDFEAPIERRDVKKLSLRRCDDIVEFVKKITEGECHRIAICSWAFNGSGGVSRVVGQQARDLARAGFDITIFALEADMKPPKGVKLSIIGCPKNCYLNRIHRISFPLSVNQMWKYAKELGRFDLIISHRYPATSLALLANRLFGVKYVYWYHYYPDASFFPSFFHRVWLRIIRYLEVKALSVRKADMICSVSEASSRVLREKSGLDSIIVPNKADTGRFGGGDVSRLRRKYGIDEEEHVILFVGRLTPQKNVHSLIRVFKSVKRTIPNSKLIIVGNPSIKQYFERCKKLAKEDVVFAGYVSDEDLSGFYSLCDIYATCSLSEGSNIPPAEAESFGKPVIAFDTPEQREVVRKGVLVEPEDYKEFTEKMIATLRERGQGSR